MMVPIEQSTYSSCLLAHLYSHYGSFSFRHLDMAHQNP